MKKINIFLLFFILLFSCSKISKGNIYFFSSFGFPQKYICHQNFLCKIEDFIEGNNDFKFKIVEGLAGNGSISFESVNFPNYFIRHSSFRLFLSPKEENENFYKDASFFVREGLADKNMVSFESVNFPNYFIRHSSFLLFISENNNSEIFKQDATFHAIKVKN